MITAFSRFFRVVAACVGGAMLWSAARAQVAADPVLVPVQFQGVYTGSSGSVTISLDGTHNSTSSGAPANETTNGLANLRPGRCYTFTITQSQIQNVKVKVTPPSGYRVFINAVEHELFDWSPPDGSPGYFTVRLDDGGGAAVGEAGTLRPGNVLWSVGLGNLKNGKPAGSLMIAEEGLTTNTFTPQGLFYDRDIGDAHGVSDEGEVEIIKPGNILRQVYATTVLADIVQIDSHTYNIDLYPRDSGQIGTPDGTTGVYSVSGNPLYRFTIENPATNTLRITKTVQQGETLVTWTDMTRTSIGTSGNVTTEIWTVQDWVKKPAGSPTSVDSPVKHRWTIADTKPSNVLTSRDELMEVLDGSTTIRRVLRHYDVLNFSYTGADSLELSYEETGSGSTAVRTSYTYHTSNVGTALGAWHRIKTVTCTDGSWTAFDYESDYYARGRINQIRRPFKDAPTADPGSGSTSGEVTKFFYGGADAWGLHNLERIEKWVSGTQVGKTEFSYATESFTDPSSDYASSANALMPIVVVTRKDYFGTGSSDYLTTVTRTYREDADPEYHFFTGLPHSVIKPDLTATAMAYFRADFQSNDPFYASTSGGARVHVVLNGTTDTSKGTAMTSYPGAQPLPANFRIVLGKTGKTMTLMGEAGLAKVSQQEAYALTTGSSPPSGAWSVVSQDWVTYVNSLWPSIVERRTGASGAFWRVADRTWTKGRLASSISETGVTQIIDYDDLGRVLTTRRLGGTYGSISIKEQTITNTFDLAGALITQVLSGVGSSETITNGWTYDQAGRVLTETAPLPNGTLPSSTASTSYQYNIAARSVTATLPAPSGVTSRRIETRFIDGRVASVSGEAVVAESYDYGVGGNPLQTKVTLAGISTRTRTAVVDWLGRPTSTTMPGFGTVGDFVETSSYDSTQGQLISVARTGYATTRYEYGDGMGAVTRSGLDVDGGGLLPASTDRITDADTYVENDSGTLWLTSQQWAYPYSSSPPTGHTAGERVQIAKSSRRLTGLSPTLRSDLRTWDADNVLTERMVTYEGAQVVTSTTTRDGFTTAATEKSLTGFPIMAAGFDGTTVWRTYDHLGRLQTEFNERSGTTTTVYFDHTTLVQDVYNDTSHFTRVLKYDPAGRPIVLKDAADKTTRRAYNARGQLLYQWGSGVQPVAFTYDDNTGERLKMWTYQANITAAEGGTSYGWNVDAWPAASVTFNETRWEYEAATGLLMKKYDADNKYVEYTYNLRGQTATRTWARGVVSSYTYDSATGELTDIAYTNDAAQTKPVRYTYTRLGQLAKVWDGTTGPVGNTSDYREMVYDSAQPVRLSAVMLPAYYDTNTSPAAHRVLSRRYDGIKRPNGFSLGYGSTLSADLDQTLSFSTNGQLSTITSVWSGSASRVHTYGYVAKSSLVASLQSGSGSNIFRIARTYESNRDLLTSVEATWNTSTRLSRYEYENNALGQRTRARQLGTAFADYYPGSSYDSTLNAYQYGDHGELQTAVTYRGSASSTPLTVPDSPDELTGRRFEYRYDVAGNRKTAGPTGLQSHVDDAYQVNNRDQYTTKENNTVRVLGTVGMPSSGNMDDVAVAAQSTGTSTSTTSQPSTQVTVNRRDRSFAADISPGNSSGPQQGILSVYAAPSGSSVALQQRNWLVPQQTQTLSYDLDGNLTGDGVWSYSYDAENRLVQMLSLLPSGFGNRLKLNFEYDYLGRRVQKRVYDLTASAEVSCRRYLYDGWDLVAEFDANVSGSTVTCARLVRSYTWGLDIASSLGATGGVGALLQIVDHGSGKVFLPTYDGNGNIISLVNAANGTFAAVYEYGPFGENLRTQIIDQVDLEVASQPFRFSSKFFDGESGLVYYGARFYSTDLGRFINRDPIGEAGGLNLYGFCGNDAINHWDYLGNSWLSKQLKSIGNWITKNKQAIITVVAIAASIWVGGLAMSAVYSSTASSIAASGAMTVYANAGLLGSAVAGGTISGTTASVLAGIAGGAAGGAVAGGIMTGTVKGALQGAAAGAIMGGVQGYYMGANLAVGKPGQAFPWSRVPVQAAAGGLASEVQGGSFRQGFEISGAIAGATKVALWMREKMIVTDKDLRNRAGVSDGVNDDGEKVGGGRVDVEKGDLYQNGNLNPKDIAPLGGFQGGPGSFFGKAYPPGGFLDHLIEHFAGPHDWLGSWWSYDSNGDNNPTHSFFGRYLGRLGAHIMDNVSTAVDIPLAAPFAAAPVVGLAPYAASALMPPPHP